MMRVVLASIEEGFNHSGSLVIPSVGIEIKMCCFYKGYAEAIKEQSS